MKPYIVLCSDCYEPYRGKRLEELTIGIVLGNCERCGRPVASGSKPPWEAHTPRRSQVEAEDKCRNGRS